MARQRLPWDAENQLNAIGAPPACRCFVDRATTRRLIGFLSTQSKAWRPIVV